MASPAAEPVQASQASNPEPNGSAVFDEAQRKARQDEAQALIRRNVYWALGAGAVPFPIVDALGVTAVQVKMLRELSKLYDVPFFENKVRNLVASLVSGLGSVTLASALAGSVAKFIPVAGAAVGLLGVPILAAAFTHSTGKVFMMHFESGGTFLDFKPEAMRDYFREEFEKAKAVVVEMQKEEQAKPKEKSKPAS